MFLYDVLKKSIVTEKATNQNESGQISFFVDRNATKTDVKYAVEQIFNVKVLSVNTLILKGKQKTFKGKRALLQDRKKAIVTLAPDQNVDLGIGDVK